MLEELKVKADSNMSMDIKLRLLSQKAQMRTNEGMEMKFVHTEEIWSVRDPAGSPCRALKSDSFLTI